MLQDTANTSTEGSTKTKVLIVEDDTLIIDMVGRKLTDAGFTTKLVIDGGDAIAEATLFGPDVIILDLMLPNKSGEEILKELSQQSIFSNTKIIVFTNKNREENEAHVKELGADTYLVKASTDLDALVSHIKQLAS
jgi:DNA-binding response OmpR family regulator